MSTLERLHAFVYGRRFNLFITCAILTAGVVVGAQTYPWMTQQFGGLLRALELTIVVIFVLEAALKILSEGRRPWRYFKDGWNIFDFSIVVLCLLPFDASFVSVLRLARILRVLKLVRALPKLQVLAGALIKSIPSMAYVGLLLTLLFYVYAVSATFLFGDNDPIHFDSLQLSMVSLFRVVTLEDWTDIMYIQMYGCDQYGYEGHLAALCTAPAAYPVFGALFFISFVLMGTMIILNLFIGVILSGMEEAQREAEHEERIRSQGELAPSMEDELLLLEQKLDELKAHLHRVQVRSRKQL